MKLGTALIGLLLTHTSVAAAYCRSTTCSPRTAPPEDMCESDDYGCPSTGVPLSWRTGCVSFSVHSTGSVKRNIDFDLVHQIAVAAFDTWLSADCGDGTPSLQVVDLSPVECGQAEYNPTGPNANVILFRDEEWPHDETAVAITTVTQDLDTGAIYDADVEINSAQQNLTTGNDDVGYDLESVLTHEVGHFLGLDDNNDPDTRATMYGYYHPGDTWPRELSGDDERGICSIYPPDEAPTSVQCTPRHGFSAECAPNVTSGCGCATPGRSTWEHAQGPVGLGFLALVSCLRRRRRSHGGARRRLSEQG